MRAFDKIRTWLASRGYSMEPGVGYACYWLERRVTYRAHDARETQLRGLLHECGHVLVGRSVTRGPGTRYLRGYTSKRAGKARTNASAADVMHEELEAWHRGFALARRLQIRVNTRLYWQDYGLCIKRYCRRLSARLV